MQNSPSFWEQYKHILRNRRPLWQRFLRLLFAFAAALVTGCICLAIERLTHARWAAMLAGVVMAGLAAVVCWTAQSFLDRTRSFAIPPTCADAAPLDAVVVDPGSPFPAPPAKWGGGRLLVAFILASGVLVLCCCGGVVTLLTGLSAGRNAIRTNWPVERRRSVPVMRQLPNHPSSVPFSDFERRQEELAKQTRQRQREIEGRVKHQQQRIEEAIRRQRKMLPDGQSGSAVADQG